MKKRTHRPASPVFALSPEAAAALRLRFGLTLAGAGLLLLSLLAPPFSNYGVDYYAYLPAPACAAILLPLLALAWLVPVTALETGFAALARRWKLVLLVAAPLAGLLFWLLRTRIHVFMGDGAIRTLAEMDGPLVFRRLDDLLRALFDKGVVRYWPLERIEGLPSMFSQQLYSVFFGVLAVTAVLAGFRKTPIQGLALLAMPFTFNFFGNVDSYAAPVFFWLLFAVLLGNRLADGRPVRFLDLLLFGALWGLGLWMHPFALFLGFPMIHLGCQWLQTRSWRGRPLRLPQAWPLILYGLALLTALQLSRYGNKLFKPDDVHVPPAFSWQTASHYFNTLLLPLLPWLWLTFPQRRTETGRLLWIAFLCSSAVFFVMRFTLGAADQFNYANLLAAAAVPAALHLLRHPLPPLRAWALLLVQLVVLIPLILVHSSPKTIDRARRIYPRDRCHHNMIMTWQTHLGIILMDNIQYSPDIARHVPAIFRDGSEHGLPETLRGGNFVYFAASHYQYGRITEGRRLLQRLLTNAPQAIQFLLSDRPGFIYYNREILWDDVERFFPVGSPEEKALLKARLDFLKEETGKRVYTKRPSPWEKAR